VPLGTPHEPGAQRNDRQLHKYSILSPLSLPLAVIVLAVVGSGCGGGDGDNGNNPPRGIVEWTVLAYMDGDGDLEEALIGDFNEMEVIGSTSSVHVIVQMDRHPSYDFSNGNWTTARRFRVQRDPAEAGVPQNGQHNNIIVTPNISDIGEVNMAEEDVLVDFVEWGMQEYPAERYILAMVDHGWGWRPRSVGTRGEVSSRGIIFDETSGSDSLSNAELKSALQRIKQTRGKNLEVLALDVSEEALLEVAYQVRDSVDYVVASLLSEPNDGYPYDAILHRLTGDPQQPTEQFLLGLLQDYVDSYEPGQQTVLPDSSATQSVFRESELQDLVDATDALAQALRGELPGAAADLVGIRTATQSYSELIYRDLYDFAERVKAHFNNSTFDALCQAVMDANGPGPGTALLGEVHRTGTSGFPTTNVDDSHGIMVYLPALPTQYLTDYATAVDFATDTQWDEYISDNTGR